MSSNRRIDLDVLKVISLLCIMFAHVNPPGILFQLRNFDVVLLILISAFLGLKTYKMDENIFRYYFKRFKRLVIPTWIFLILLFIILICFKISDVNFSQILDTFILNGGIGYVWVIRIYMIIALLIPLCIRIVTKKKSLFILISTISFYVIYELLYYYGLFDNSVLLYLLAYIIPCYVLIILSYYLFDNNKVLYITLLINFIIFIIMAFYYYKTTGMFQTTNIQKYPFRLYYLSYGLFTSSILILIFKSKKICNFLNNRVIRFISSNSLWIYLWHILFIFIYKPFKSKWILYFLLVFCSSLLVTFIQNKIVSKLNGTVNYEILKIFKC